MSTEEEVRQIKQRHAPELLKQRGVSGVGIEKDDAGDFVLVVYLETDDPQVRAQLPQELEGHPVKYIQSGPFRKFG